MYIYVYIYVYACQIMSIVCLVWSWFCLGEHFQRQVSSTTTSPLRASARRCDRCCGSRRTSCGSNKRGLGDYGFFSHYINITVLYICIYFVTCRCWLVDVGIFVLWQAVDLWIFWSLMNGKLCGALKRLALATRALRLICIKDCMAGRFTFTFFIFIYSVSHFVCECMHSSLIQRSYGEWLQKRGRCLCCRYPGYPPWSVEEPSYTCWDEEKWVFIHVKLDVFAELAGPL